MNGVVFWCAGEVEREVGEPIWTDFISTVRCGSASLVLALPSFERTVRIVREHRLGMGEADAIALAEQESLVLLSDDKRARTVGKQLLASERVTGSLGVLLELKAQGILQPSSCATAYESMLAGGGFLPPLSSDFFYD